MPLYNPKVTGGVDISDADAVVADVIASKTFYATSGGKKTGIMTDNGTVSTDISAVATEVTIAAGKHSGSGIVKIASVESAKIIAGNIKKDIVILGVTGSVEAGVATSGDYKVRFLDFDGTILKEEWVDSGNNATAPTTPTHTYLTFNSWNSTFTNVTSNLDVGAIYDTTDGKSYLFIRVTPTTGLSPTLYVNKSTTALMTINWGDGGADSTSTSSGNVTFAKTYAVEGDYIITISCSGGYILGQSFQSIFAGNYTSILRTCYIGANVASMEGYTFRYSYSLTNISIPSSVTSILASSFSGNWSLIFISIPSGVTSISNNLFLNCYSLTGVSMPSSITLIGISSFENCYSLKFASIPSTVTSLGGACFKNCNSLTFAVIPSGVTSLGDEIFYRCISLESVLIPSSVTSIGWNIFDNCQSLTTISTLSGITAIPYYCFNLCYALRSISLPIGVTSISNNSFYNCYSLNDYQIAATTPPTLTAGAFTGINLSTKIYVPDANVSAYKAATNWVTYANYIYPISTRP